MQVNEIIRKINANRKEVLEMSLINCHAEGLHSIVFDKTSDGLKRVFVTDANHTLWRNDFFYVDGFWVPKHLMSVAIHPHHCDVKLSPLRGRFVNHFFRKSRPDGKSVYIDEYFYVSPISKNAGKFEKRQLQALTLEESSFVLEGDDFRMQAKDLHTVWVAPGEEAAWLVEESNEDAEYQSVCYSNDDLTNFDFSPLYKPMTEGKLDEIISRL